MNFLLLVAPLFAEELGRKDHLISVSPLRHYGPTPLAFLADSQVGKDPPSPHFFLFLNSFSVSISTSIRKSPLPSLEPVLPPPAEVGMIKEEN